MSEEGNGQDASMEKQAEINPADFPTFIITLNKKDNRVDVKGPINDIPSFYLAVEMAKDCVRKWNELNNNYLKAEPVTGSLPPPGKSFFKRR